VQYIAVKRKNIDITWE